MKNFIFIFLIMAGMTCVYNAQNENNTTNAPYDIGERWFARKEYRNAVLFYSKAVERNYIPAYYKRGMSFFELGRYDRAIRDFDKCIENNYLVDEAKAKKELALNEQKKIVKTETKTDYGSGGSSEFTAKQFYDQGFKQYLSEDFEKALINFTTATEWNPSLADAYALKANTNFALKNYEEAIKDCNKAIEKKDFINDTNLSDIYYTRGSAYNMSQKFEAALKDLNEAINGNLKKGVFYTVRGSVKYNLGNKTGACEDWNLASKNGDFINASKLLEEFCK